MQSEEELSCLQFSRLWRNAHFHVAARLWRLFFSCVCLYVQFIRLNKVSIEINNNFMQYALSVASELKWQVYRVRSGEVRARSTHNSTIERMTDIFNILQQIHNFHILTLRYLS